MVCSHYVFIRVDRRCYRAHRLAWLYMTGEMPIEVDHLNLNRADNRWQNLRVATRVQNAANSPARRPSITGIKGVRRLKSGRWYARIMSVLGWIGGAIERIVWHGFI